MRQPGLGITVTQHIFVPVLTRGGPWLHLSHYHKFVSRHTNSIIKDKDWFEWHFFAVITINLLFAIDGLVLSLVTQMNFSWSFRGILVSSSNSWLLHQQRWGENWGKLQIGVNSPQWIENPINHPHIDIFHILHFCKSHIIWNPCW